VYLDWTILAVLETASTEVNQLKLEHKWLLFCLKKNREVAEKVGIERLLRKNSQLLVHTVLHEIVTDTWKAGRSLHAMSKRVWAKRSTPP
jgi:hypothetical protein